MSLLWSASAVAAPIAILIALYWSIAGFDRSIPFASAALVLAAFYAYATEALSRGTARSEAAPRARSRQARYSQPARSPRLRWRFPLRWRKAGSPSRLR